jgi:ATP-dependent RNA helicase DeaD
LERLDKNIHSIQALILTPTRELAIQLADDIKSFADDDVKIQLLY